MRKGKKKEFKKPHQWISSDVWRGDPEALKTLRHIKGIGYKTKGGCNYL